MKFHPILYFEICTLFRIVGILFGKSSYEILEIPQLKVKLIYINFKDGITL